MPKHGVYLDADNRNCTPIASTLAFRSIWRFGSHVSIDYVQEAMTINAKPNDPAACFQPLLTEKALRAALGGLSERKFKNLRASGVIPDPLELGPRQPRWTQQDYLEVLRRLPRRPMRQEPETLAEGRRARIERIKAGTTTASL